MSASRTFSEPGTFLSGVVGEVVARKSGLTPDELRELGVRCDVAYDMSRMGTRFRLRWLNGGENMRQLDFFMDDDMQSITNQTDVASAFAARATEQANLRGELQFHRLEQRMPKRIKEVLIGPTVHAGQPVPAGMMCIVFHTGMFLICTELETLSPEFVAKCLMLV